MKTLIIDHSGNTIAMGTVQPDPNGACREAKRIDITDLLDVIIADPPYRDQENEDDGE